MVVINRVIYGKELLKPVAITGVWNVRLKENGSGTSINVNLTNLDPVLGTNANPKDEIAMASRSTGVFEKIIYEIIR